MKAIIKCKDIPEENLFNHYNEEELNSLFDVLEEEFIENGINFVLILDVGELSHLLAFGKFHLLHRNMV